MDVRHYAIATKCNKIQAKQATKQEKWLTQMLSMWIISQKDNEYNPMHIHTECQLSSDILKYQSIFQVEKKVEKMMGTLYL